MSVVAVVCHAEPGLRRKEAEKKAAATSAVASTDPNDPTENLLN